MLQERLIANLHLTDFIAKHGFDPYFRDFIFGNCEKYTVLRNQSIMLGPNGPVTMLSAMLRYGLDEAKRINLFPSPFHLGAVKSIPGDQLTLTALAKLVRREKGQRDEPESRKKEFETITDAIKDITGNRFGDYGDKQNSLRVIYLFDRMMKIEDQQAMDERKKSEIFESRSLRFLTFIKAPTTRFSFEARDAYAIAESEGNTHLLNDLKAYLGIEIEVETLDEIDSFFFSLIDRVDGIRAHLDSAAHASGLRARTADRYRALKNIVDSIQVPLADSPADRSMRLDQDLYLHLSRFQFLHFAGAHRHILAEAKPPSEIIQIKSEMITALSMIARREQGYFDITDKIVSLVEFQDFSVQHAGVLRQLLKRAIGIGCDDTQYTRIINLSGELLYRISVFGRAGVTRRRDVLVSFSSIVSALCAVAQALRYRTRYRPYVYGDDSQTRSIITPLETVLDLEGHRPPREVHEGYLQLWHNRREWVQAALEGTEDVAKLRFDLRKALWTKAIDCVQPNDIALIKAAFSKLEASLLDMRLDDLGI